MILNRLLLTAAFCWLEDLSC